MDTASIRIKFTPLVKNINLKNSKCYLEIIPELSYVTNIDKMKWRKGYDFIEYKVPMNYRIVFKKVAPADNDDQNKTYYSCVDLLHSASLSKIELGSGDVSRIVSENAIAKKLTSTIKNDEKCKIILTKDHTLDLKSEYLKKENSVTSEVEILEENLREASLFDLKDDTDEIRSKEHNSGKVKKAVSVQIQISKTFINKNKVDKITGEGTDVFEANVIKPRSAETLTNFNAKLEPKLTLTSFISIDTNIKPLLQTVYRNNSFYNSNIYCDHVNKKCDLKNTSNVTNYSLVNYQGKSMRGTQKDNFKDMKYNHEFKVLPALRLSHFKQKMEKELLPIRIKLNEIICKCIPLGLLNYQKYGKAMLYEPYSYMNIDDCCKEHELASNRVVYSVVYNE